MNLARLNHILIPHSHGERERLRGSAAVAVFWKPLNFLHTHLTWRGRALGLVTIIVGALGLHVETTQVYVVFALLAGLCVAALAMTGPFALGDVAIEVTCPQRIAIGQLQRFAVSLTNRGAASCRSTKVMGPFLPWDGRFEGEIPITEEILPGAVATVSCVARFSARGEHHLDPFNASALLPLGLSSGPPVVSNAARFMVVPCIAPVGRLTLPIARRYHPGGIAQASKTGESMDLLGVRPYRPGDPLRDLHARSWARVGIPVVREYQEEYFSRVGVVVDTDLGKGDPRRLEAALSVAAGILAKLTGGEALIDVLVVGEEVPPLTLGRSLGFLDEALDLLACVSPGRAFDAARLAERLAPFLSRLGGVVFIALDWDAERARFAEMVRARGVACHTLVLDGPQPRFRASAVAGAPALQRHDRIAVAVEAVERREPLWL